MQTIKGKCNEAIVFASDVEQEALNQIHRFLDHPAFAGGRIRIMPDVHAGAGAVIGFTAQLGDKVIPNVVGVDIGCGVAAWKIPDPGRLHFDRFDKFVRENVPSGFDVRQERYDRLRHLLPSAGIGHVSPYLGSGDGLGGFGLEVNEIVDRLTEGKRIAERDVFRERVWNALGSLGGGNHFIELDRADDGCIWLIVHSGSRNFGLQIAVWHQKRAVEQHGKMGGLEWLEGDDAQGYIHDMLIAQGYAALNRRVMGEVLLGFFGVKSLDEVEQIESVHNYIDFKDRVVRKGAIAARKGQPVIIPLTMADGCIVGTGRGNEEWNCSAPHGAGRVMARRKAKETLDLDVYRDRMRKAGVWSSCVGKGTLDEAPMAYRRPKGLVEALAATVDVQQVMRPIYNFKAGADE